MTPETRGAPASIGTKTGANPNKTIDLERTSNGADGTNTTSPVTGFESPLPGALECTRRTWRVFPVEAPVPGDRRTGKAPAELSPGRRFTFTRNATSDPDVVRRWDLEGRGLNYGVYAAGSGLLILDEDRPGAIDEWAAHLGVALPPTFTVKTGNGRHLYFLADGVTFSQRDAWPGVNVRFEGFVVGPGSVHAETGALYTVTDDRDPVSLPSEAREALTAVPRPMEQPAHEQFPVEASPRTESAVLGIVPVVIRKLQYAASMPEGERNSKGQSWESKSTIAHDAASLVRLSNTAPTAYSLDRAEADFMATAPRGEEERWLRKWEWATQEVGSAVREDLLFPENAFEDLGPGDSDRTGPRDGARHLVVQRASEIRMRRVLWLWAGRMALGTLSLLAGREGLGKSSLIAWLIAQMTRGTLPGDLHGQPRAVIIAATEDSWEHTLVPRLVAAGADLHLVLRVDVMTSKGFTVDVSLPEDIPAVKQLALQENVALMVLDPLMSRLHNLDTHKDAEVRIALEPLVRMADEVGMSLIGLIHLNKSSTDPLNAVMGSKAFTAVARSVSTVVPDDSDEDDRRRLFGTVKNNLGPALPASQVYTIETAEVPTEDGPMPVGKLVWHGEVDTTIKSAMADTGMESRSAVTEAQVWLYDFLSEGATLPRKDVITAAKREGISESAAKRAARNLKVVSTSSGFPRTAHWSLPDPFEADAPGDDA